MARKALLVVMTATLPFLLVCKNGPIVAEGALAWRCKLPDDCGGHQGPAMAGADLILVQTLDSLYAVDKNGNVAWRTASAGGGWRVPVVSPDGLIYINLRDSVHGWTFLGAVNKSGQVVWRGTFMSEIVAVDKDSIIYGTWPSSVWARRREQSGPLWETAIAGVYQLAVDSDRLVFATTEDTVFVLDAKDGAVLHKFSPGGLWITEVVDAGNGQICFVRTDTSFYTFFVTQLDGTPVVQLDFEAPWTVTSPSVDHNGVAYFGLGREMLAIQDRAIKWRYGTEGSIMCQPSVSAEGCVYFTTWDGYLYCLGPAGELRWKYAVKVSGSAPAIGDDGTVYLATADSCLIAICGKGALSDGPWPKFRCDNGNTGCGR